MGRFFEEHEMKKKLEPFSKEVVDACVERVRRMTPDEALTFLMYRTPGIEETDTTGMFPEYRVSARDVLEKELIVGARK
jgi:hypothetical protein